MGITESLFSIMRKPRSKASKDTISNWVKKFLKLSGINTKIFSAHSTMSTSIALKSLSSEGRLDNRLK